MDPNYQTETNSDSETDEDSGTAAVTELTKASENESNEVTETNAISKANARIVMDSITERRNHNRMKKIEEETIVRKRMNQILYFVIDGRRTEYRRKKKTGFFKDFFVYSHFTDYCFLRLCLHFLIGFVICYSLYGLLWFKLNFASDTNGRYIYKWFFIMGTSCAYAWFPPVRCVFLCIILGSLSKYGQGILSVQTVDFLREGPVINMIENTKEVMNYITCNIELQTRIQFNRITLASGPVEAMMERYFGRTANLGRKIIKTLTALLNPVAEELSKARDSEDIGIDSLIGNIETMGLREKIVQGGSYIKDKTKDLAQSAKNKLEQVDWKAIRIERLTRACKELFAGAVKKCEEKLQEVESMCYSYVPWPINSWLCKKLNILTLCTPAEMMDKAAEVCDFAKKLEFNVDLVPPNAQEQMERITNVSNYIKNQFRLTLHFQAIQFPRHIRIRALSEIKAIVKGIYKVVAEVLSIFQECLSLIMIVLLLFIVKNVIRQMDNYLTDLEFKNNFITPYFWKIDKARSRLGKPYLGRIEKLEKREFKLLRISSTPTDNEFEDGKYAFCKWLVLSLVVIAICIFDHLFYEFLTICTKYDYIEHTFVGNHSVNITVNGTGAIADLMRDLLNFNHHMDLNQTYNNSECRLKPNITESSHYWILSVILLGMLLFQVIFNFVLKRAMLIGLFGFTFVQQYKERAQFLYNNVLKYRLERRAEQMRHMKGSIIREQCYRRVLKKYPAEEEAWDFTAPKFLGYILKLEECLLCQGRFRKKHVFVCQICSAQFCEKCFEELNSECHSCKLIHQMGFADPHSELITVLNEVTMNTTLVNEANADETMINEVEGSSE